MAEAAVSKADPHELRDSLVADLVATSEAKTGERKGREALELVVPVLERMDHKPARKNPSGGAANEQLREQAQKAGIEGRVERFTPDVQSPEAIRDQGYSMLAQRFQWMKRSAGYREHLQGIAAGMMLGGEHRERAAERLRQLLAKSAEQLKWPWHKPKPKALIFHG